jgi:hypothetical protein
VFCEKSAEAAVPIKSFSPDLMVLPVIPTDVEPLRKDPAILKDVDQNWISKLDCLVIGPGLGRSDAAALFVHSIVAAAKLRQLPLILDGDALFFLNTRLSLVSGYERAILTPNGMVTRVSTLLLFCFANVAVSVQEFQRLWTAAMGQTELKQLSDADVEVARCLSVSRVQFSTGTAAQASVAHTDAKCLVAVNSPLAAQVSELAAA